jgi:hypothetical protein
MGLKMNKIMYFQRYPSHQGGLSDGFATSMILHTTNPSNHLTGEGTRDGFALRRCRDGEKKEGSHVDHH